MPCHADTSNPHKYNVINLHSNIRMQVPPPCYIHMGYVPFVSKVAYNCIMLCSSTYVHRKNIII